MKGQCFLIRFADDFVIGCELESDAKRIMEVLPKRLGRFGLSIHPEKSKLLSFGKPSRNETRGHGGCGTFDFLGFTHYWARSRQGYWVIKRKTASKRQRRAKKALWEWCRRNRHLPIPAQHKQLSLKLQGHFLYYLHSGQLSSTGLVASFRRTSVAVLVEPPQSTWFYHLGKVHAAARDVSAAQARAGLLDLSLQGSKCCAPGTVSCSGYRRTG